MNKLIWGFFIALICPAVFGQARLGEYPWNVTLKIVDDNGNPVEEARTWVAYNSPKEGQSIDPFHSPGWAAAGLTDTNGMFVALHTDRSWKLGIHSQKVSYYSSYLNYQLYVPGQFDLSKVTSNRNPTLKIILRKIGNPVPMYAKRQELKFPKLDQPIGFDLMEGDWVNPYGKGLHTDIFFKAHRNIINEREYTAQLSVTFPNKGDGITVAPSELVTGSEFKTSRTATETGYQPELKLDFSNSKSPEPVFGYFIRVRTVLDEQGMVKSALYGKISGDFRFYAGTIAPTSGMGFDYYLNPTPNDRNVEFDPRHNLVKNLGPLEGVAEP